MGLFPTGLQNLMPHLDVCDPDCRVAFIHGVSRKKLLAWPATQMQSGVVALSALVTNRQPIARTNTLDGRPTCALQA
jgi:hypothetical protein